MYMEISKKDALTIYRLLEASVPAYVLSVPDSNDWRKNKRLIVGRIEKFLTEKNTENRVAK